MPLLRNLSTKEPLRGMVLSNGFAGTISGAILEEPDLDASHFSPDGSFGRPASEASGNSSWFKLESEKLSLSGTSSPSRPHSPISTPGTSDGVPEVPPSQLFVVSAKSVAALQAYIKKYIDFCQKASSEQFESICYTACVGREHYRYRFSCVAENLEDLISQLQDAVSNKPSNTPLRNVALAFPGQGSQYQGMARDLAIRFSSFQAIVTDSATQAANITGLPIISYLLDTEPPQARSLSESDIAQVCIFVYQYSVGKWLQDLGLAPCAVLGHSLGEIAAAAIAGSFSFEAALEFVIKRASVLRPDLLRPAGMAAIGANAETVNGYLDSLSLRDRLTIAVYNAENSVVVSGALDAIDTLVSTVKQEGLKATRLDVNQAFHSPYVSPAMPALKKWLQDRARDARPLKLPFYSSAHGRQMSKGDRLDADYWVNHAQNPVLFLDAAKTLASDGSVDAVLDLGPQPFIWAQFQNEPLSKKPSFSVVAKRGKCQATAFLTTLSQLFRHGVEVDFVRLLDGPFGCAKISLPTYPFQRIHNYPTYRPSRNQALPSPSSSEGQKEVKIPFVVDHSLCETLNDHRIDGQRIVPGAVFADFFATAVSSKSLDELRFHRPLVAEQPDDSVFGEVKGSDFVLWQGTTKVCSGKIATRAPSSVPQWSDDERLPLRIVKKSAVYECFKNVQFGSSFRNIHEIKVWDDHADAIVSVASTGSEVQDRVRKLDACMHMFGAVAGITLPELTAMDGAFLPSSLQNFHLHSDSLPSTFLVRYKLPVAVGRNSRVLSVSMAVYSLSGQALFSCENYSVAFLPSGVAVPNAPPKAVEQKPKWFNNTWTPTPLPPVSAEVPQADELLYLGLEPNPPLLQHLRKTAAHAIFVRLPTAAILGNESTEIANIFRNTRISIVLDLTSLNAQPGSDLQTTLSHQVLAFFQLLMNSSVDITSLVILSSNSLPVHSSSIGVQREGNAAVVSTSGAIHGMLRVFKRECGLDSVAWSLDLPPLSDLQEEVAASIILDELAARNAGVSHEGQVAYRYLKEGYRHIPTRMTPSLQPVLSSASTAPPSFFGVAVIAGMGSIGVALAAGLVEAGVESVVFLGRRERDAQTVVDEFSRMDSALKAKASYRQVDITNKGQLEESLKSIQSDLGSIRHIIHTAAVMRDAAIPNLTPAAFDEVQRPKVAGAWNLHVLSQKLALTLDSFVVLSSTNVLVGNPGQVAYVAANSFLDYLAGLRHSMGLPGTSLQLGAWESALIEKLNMKKSFALLMSHKEGVPLVLKAMSASHPVQVVAEFDVAKLMSVKAYAMDPFFASILPKAPAAQQPAVPVAAAPAPPAHVAPQEPGPAQSAVSSKDTKSTMVDILRSVMELRPSETLDVDSSLTACGGDSITFAQLRGRVLKEVGVDLPAMFLAETYTIGDIIEFAVKGGSN
ncbi:hypothetical protein NMY22_g17136 [Coprinellus aureogranulatus]|nr:hypothetical protein NMY22_g17136 [Coprinellus aureogranulatus]